MRLGIVLLFMATVPFLQGCATMALVNYAESTDRLAFWTVSDVVKAYCATNGDLYVCMKARPPRSLWSRRYTAIIPVGALGEALRQFETYPRYDTNGCVVGGFVIHEANSSSFLLPTDVTNSIIREYTGPSVAMGGRSFDFPLQIPLHRISPNWPEKDQEADLQPVAVVKLDQQASAKGESAFLRRKRESALQSSLRVQGGTDGTVYWNFYHDYPSAFAYAQRERVIDSNYCVPLMPASTRYTDRSKYLLLVFLPVTVAVDIVLLPVEAVGCVVVGVAIMNKTNFPF